MEDVQGRSPTHFCDYKAGVRASILWPCSWSPVTGCVVMISMLTLKCICCTTYTLVIAFAFAMVYICLCVCACAHLLSRSCIYRTYAHPEARKWYRYWTWEGSLGFVHSRMVICACVFVHMLSCRDLYTHTQLYQETWGAYTFCICILIYIFCWCRVVFASDPLQMLKTVLGFPCLCQANLPNIWC